MSCVGAHLIAKILGTMTASVARGQSQVINMPSLSAKLLKGRQRVAEKEVKDIPLQPMGVMLKPVKGRGEVLITPLPSSFSTGIKSLLSRI